ncbi:hypothetical protein D3C87_1781480 [compost metagenome]
MVGITALLFYTRAIDLIVKPRQASYQEKPAGKIVDIKMYDLVFIPKSTITTTIGIYQVGGAVSAIIGDTATFKVETFGNNSKKSFLCIESEVKTDCYRIL